LKIEPLFPSVILFKEWGNAIKKQEIEGKRQTSAERNMTGKENSLKRESAYLLPRQPQEAKRR